ncbi:MAG: alpha/beta hydrolase [Nitrospiria bacterium]
MATRIFWNEVPASQAVEGCVVFLHGRGTTGKDLMPLADEIAFPSLRWIFPDAPFPFLEDFDGRMWFASPPEQHGGIIKSRILLSELLDHLIVENQIPSRKIVLMGFSQGAVMSLDVGIRFHLPLAGLIAMSGFLHSPETVPEEKSPASAEMPILLVHGMADPVVKVDGSRQALSTLRKEGYTVNLQEYPMGHQVIPEEIVLIRKHLSQFLERS